MIRATGLIRVLGIVAAVLYMTAGPANAGDVPMPHPAQAIKGKTCVAPIPVMRRYHMKFLMHERDETVREGIRGGKFSLKECVDCHAVARPNIMGGKVRTLQPFCSQCHQYAAVHIDCFECHNPTRPLEDKTGDKKTGLNVPPVGPKTGSTQLAEAIMAHLKAGEDRK